MLSVTDPALAAILQRRRLLSEPQEATLAPAKAPESPAVAVRPGLVQEALQAIEERLEPKPEPVQCFDMATDSESEEEEKCRPADCGGHGSCKVTPSHRARRPRATRTSLQARKSGGGHRMRVFVWPQQLGG